jgi:hypothetical protein
MGTGTLLSLLNIYLIPSIDFSSSKSIKQVWLRSLITVIGLLLFSLLLKRAIANPKHQKLFTLLSCLCLLASAISSILMVAHFSLAHFIHRLSLSFVAINGAALIIFIFYRATTTCKADDSTLSINKANIQRNDIPVFTPPSSPKSDIKNTNDEIDNNNSLQTHLNENPIPKLTATHIVSY